MKKLLALVLALVMSMSLVTISNAAFDDADEIDYTEAVEVLNAVGVLVGSDGKFNPTAELNRAQACKIIAYLDLGAKAADAIKGSGEVFSDVAATAWYAGYVEYCAGAGYVSGVGDGKFAPDANVTGVQFAKMLLCALGYSAEVEGYNGSDWSLSIARDANKIDLFDGLSIVTSANLTREQAAQMALNALEATCVEYEGGTNVSTSDGTKVTVNAIRSEVKAATGVNYNDSTDTDKDTMQLCEKLYKKDLKKTSDKDAFGRPATVWTYDKDEVGTYADEPDATFTGKTSESAVYKALSGKNGSVTVAQIYEDGNPVSARTYSKSNTGNAAHFGNGIKVEAYDMGKDSDGDTIWRLVAIRDYIGYVKYVNKADADTDTDRSIEIELTITPSGFEGKKLCEKYKTEDFARKDWVIVNVAKEGVDENSKIVVQSVKAATKLSDQAVTAYKQGGMTNASVTFGGEKYSYNWCLQGDLATKTYTMSSGNTYDFYLDSYGNIIKADEYSKSNTDYVQVLTYTNKDADADGTNAKKPTTSGSLEDDYYWEVKYVAMDGTTKIDKVYAASSTATSTLEGGMIYTVAEDDDHEGYVKFTAVQTSDTTKAYYKAATISSTNGFKKSVATYGDVSFNNDTVFVVKKPNATKYTVVNGLSAMDSYTLTSNASVMTVMKDGYAVVAFFDFSGATTSTSTDSLVYIYDVAPSVSYDATNKYDINTYKTTDGTIDVKPGTNTFGSGKATPASGETGLYIVNKTTDGYASELALVTTGGKYTVKDSVTDKEVKFSGSVLTIADNGAYVLASDATVIMVDSDDNVKEVSAEELVGDKVTGKFFFVAESTSDATVNTVYFQGTVK